MKKKILIWVLAAVLVLSMAGCAAGAVSTTDKYVGMEPAAAAETAADGQKLLQFGDGHGACLP